MNIEFEFVNADTEVVDNLAHAVGMVAYFDCLNCGRMLHFSKSYEPVPLHYESLLRTCAPVTCSKCGYTHNHVHDEDGEDAVVLSPSLHPVDPAQLSLFA
jgi:C4-type Zn-finger protein